MSKKDKQIVALTYKACPICGAKDEDQSKVLLSKRFQDLSHLDHKITGFGHPCKKCQEYMEAGIVIVLVDFEKTDDPKNPWRTGELHVMKVEAVERIFEGLAELPAILEARVMFLEEKIAREIGIELPKDSDNDK